MTTTENDAYLASGRSLLDEDLTQAITDEVHRRLFGEDVKAHHKIGRYEIRGTISRRGHATVSMGWDPLLRRPLAIKVVSLKNAGALENERILREARLLARVGHPSVVSFYDVGVSEDGRAYITMELIEDAVQDLHVISPGDLLSSLISIGDGVAAVHDQGIVHRDIKLANLLISRRGRAKLIDFGSAVDNRERRLLPRGRRLTQLAGTAGYVAPEVLLGADATRCSDVFSYCVAIYQALFRSYPFEVEAASRIDGSNRLNLACLAGRYLEPDCEGIGVDRRLGEVLRRGLARYPLSRYSSMTELLMDLNRVGTDLERAARA